MSRRPRRREREAAAWLVRLNRRLVDQRDLTDFRRWREDQSNDEAYRATQRAWSTSNRLSQDPELQALARDVRRPSPSLPRAVALTGMGAAVVAAVLIATILAGRGESYATAVGERSTLRLADGSRVELDTDSRLDVRMSKAARRLELARGQALFVVAHDAARPFVVRAGALEVTATGTRFDVRREAGGGRVVLLQGGVQVRDAHAPYRPPLTLAPGQEASPQDAVPHVRPDLERVLDWTTGRLVFADTPLPVALAEANRYSRRRLSLGSDPGLQRLRVAGVFDAGDPATLAHAVAELYDLRVHERPDGSLTLDRS